MARRFQGVRPITSIRSGRFSSDTAGEVISIVQGRTGAFYRILNSGPNSFTVDDGRNPNPLSPLDKNQSLDVAIASEVKIIASGTVPIAGIYEYLDSDSPVRSGRFKLVVEDNATAQTIIDVDGGGLTNVVFYRILNSGEWPIETWAGTQVASAVTVLPENSLDFAIGSARAISLRLKQLATGAPDPDDFLIEGIYDYLGTQNPVRSGRFKFQRINNTSNDAIVDPSADAEHKIIDFRHVGQSKAWYRVFNSGTNPIHIHGKTSSIATLKEGRSYDFEVPASGSIKEIYVKSDDVDSPIEGIYDFLG